MSNPLRSRVLTVALAGAVLLAGSTLGAYAANGGPVLLGHHNKATKPTRLSAKKGPALSLDAKAGSALSLTSPTGTAPLSVSSLTKVANLNADLVDGLDATALQSKGYLYTLSADQPTGVALFSFPGLPAGRYAVEYNVGARTATGGTSFQCFFLDNSAPPIDIRMVVLLPSVGAGTNDYISGSGYLDTTVPTPQPWQMVCGTGAGAVTIGPDLGTGSNFESQVLFTPLDSVTTADSVGGTDSRARANLAR